MPLNVRRIYTSVLLVLFLLFQLSSRLRTATAARRTCRTARHPATSCGSGSQRQRPISPSATITLRSTS